MKTFTIPVPTMSDVKSLNSKLQMRRFNKLADKLGLSETVAPLSAPITGAPLAPPVVLDVLPD